MILANSVSDPTLEALTSKFPLLLIEPANTRLPTATSSGVNSPVKKELFTVLKPEITVPSVAIFSPGFTTNMSPICNSVIGMSFISPFLLISTSDADNLNNSESAEPAFRLALCSKYRPNITKNMIAAETST